jgi:hypothetical protein
MKRSFLILTTFLLVFNSCKKMDGDCDKNEVISNDFSSQRKCGSMEVLAAQKAADPELSKRMDAIEEFTQNIIANPLSSRLVNGIIEIPVVVNVLYRTTAENVSTAQIQSQIDVLNRDFAATNTDYNSTTTYNAVKSGNIKIRFELENIVRKSTNKKFWPINDAMKINKRGGIDATSPGTTLNIWVCTLSKNILGYAQFPGGDAATDGVVILNTAFGTTGTASVPFNLGRTTTHEVGHYFNLHHIWGDANCGNDFVDDTPLHNTANYGCPAAGHLSTCAGTPVEMTMNYMDYTDDACMYMFTLNQSARMRATFAIGGPRENLR